jgi:hypothetical protein
VALCGVLADYLAQQCGGLLLLSFSALALLLIKARLLNHILRQNRSQAKFEQKVACLDEN